MMDLKSISNLVVCCIILHNMGVSDRVMGDVRKMYLRTEDDGEEDIVAMEVPTDEVQDPAMMSQTEEVVIVENNNNNNDDSLVEERIAPPGASQRVTTSALDPELALTIATRHEWEALKDPVEWNRLQQALVKYKGVTRSRTDLAGNVAE